MPLVTNSDLVGPLHQGDLLNAPMLYVTADDGDSAVPIDGSEAVLVLSRNCNALRKPTVLVAVVTKYAAEELASLVKEDVGLELTRRRIEALRDGDGTPDVFYLGELPGREPFRFAAHLDSIHTIEVPVDNNHRSRWVTERRFATLTPDSRRHLQTRLFAAIAREGFDDFGWWPDGDLKIVIAAGEKKLGDLQVKMAQVTQNLQTVGCSGEGDERKLQGKITGLEKQEANLLNEKSEIESELEKHRAELASRTRASAD